MGEKSERHRCVTVKKVCKTMATAAFVLLVAASFIYVLGGLFETATPLPTMPARRLKDVTNIRFLNDENKFVWDAVPNASGYVIEADGELFTVQYGEWVCPQEISAEVVRIKAVAPGRFEDSAWSYADINN